jgi:alanine dehydrogenase
MRRTIGLPRMHEEAEERRDFLPDLLRHLGAAGASSIVIEHGYGSGMNLTEEDYLRQWPDVRVAAYEECLRQDVVVVLRCPSLAHLGYLKPGAMLVSMLHPRTHPERVELLASLGVHGFSLDAMTDDSGRRLVENLDAVAWNGTRAAFQQLQRLHPHFSHPSRRPLRVTCLGSGAVGGHAVHAATRYGDPDLRESLVAQNVPGVEVTVVDFDLTWHEDYMLGRLESTDLLIDATQRVGPSQPVIPNRWLAALPSAAVILDLACDPFDLSASPPLVKGIEGVPHGSLGRFIFEPDDPAWDRLDSSIDTRNRRLALSCYSWPGLDPVRSMRTYGEQLEPLLSVILTKPYETWSATDGSVPERALSRAEVSSWMAQRTA